MKNKQNIGIRGIRASFHHMAAVQLYGQECAVSEFLSFRSLMRALHDRRVDLGVVAIENSIAGSIMQNYALIDEFNLKVVGETYLPIQMSLLVKPGMTRSQIREIRSHPMAIRQCSTYLDSFGEDVKILEQQDTASSAKSVSTLKDMDTAAIANDLAAREYGLEVLERGIESNHLNYTRFLVLSRDFKFNGENDKSSLELILKHEVGSLEFILNIFRLQGLNLSKIQSLPLIGEPNKYKFYVDVEWDDKYRYTKALNLIKKHSREIKVLGEYKSGNRLTGKTNEKNEHR